MINELLKTIYSKIIHIYNTIYIIKKNEINIAV